MTAPMKTPPPTFEGGGRGQCINESFISAALKDGEKYPRGVWSRPRPRPARRGPGPRLAVTVIAADCRSARIWLERRNNMGELNQQLIGSAVHSLGEPVHRGDALLDIMQAAKYLRMSVRWLYRHYNFLPHIRIGFGSRPRIR